MNIYICYLFNIKLFFKYKLKLFIIKISIFLFLIIIFTKINKKNLLIKISYRFVSNNNLKILSKNKNDPIIIKEKLSLLEFISKTIGKKIYSVKSIYLGFISNFGNNFIYLNKVIFFCEILGCKRIILNKKYFWYINNKIYDLNYKLTTQNGEENNYKNRGLIIDNTFNFYYYINYIRPEFRINLLKNEIFKNLPQTKINKKDLYIYIRSDDIFVKHPHKDYSQPPLCFYRKILKNYKFNNIYIIAKNKKNPNINLLLNQFPNIIFNKNQLKIDLSYLCKAYNIVGGPSTLFFSVLQINSNIKFLWDFDFGHHNENRTNELEKLLNSFYIPKKKYTIHRMMSTIYYKKEMLDWKCSEKQINLMINSDCPFNFSII